MPAACYQQSPSNRQNQSLLQRTRIRYARKELSHLSNRQLFSFIDKLKTWLDKTLQHTPPKTALGKAVYYLHEQWERLIHYLDDGDYPIDNNRIENSIRPFAIGRKNWMFSNSQAGAKASANLYSLVETSKANGQRTESL